TRGSAASSPRQVAETSSSAHSPGAWHQLDHVELGFEGRRGKHQPPAVRPDPFDIAGDVAGRVLPVLARLALVAEDQRAEEHLAHEVAGKNQPDRALRAGQLGEALEVALLVDPAHERRVADIVE